MRKTFERVCVVAGGMIGDEGKGKVTQWMLDRYKGFGTQLCCMRTSGGSNTGATVYVNNKDKISLHMLPVGAYRDDTTCYIGPNVYINLEVLHKEMAARKSFGLDSPVFIANTAHAVFGTHIRADQAKEQHEPLGSTKNGTSIAASLKYGYKGYQLKTLNKNKYALTSTTRIGECYISDEDRKNAYDYLRDIQELGGVLVDPHEFMLSLSSKTPIVVEGSQGAALDVNHGWEYPYVSSGSFTTYGLLDGIGMMIEPTDIVMCMKPYFSYFGSQDLQRIGDEDDFRQYAGEFGSTTKRPRKLAWLDLRLLKKSVALISPTMLVINHFDTINWFAGQGRAFYIFNEEGHAVAMTQPVWENGKITQVGRFMIDIINETVGAERVYAGTGPRKENIEFVC